MGLISNKFLLFNVSYFGPLIYSLFDKLYELQILFSAERKSRMFIYWKLERTVNEGAVKFGYTSPFQPIYI